jgi:hypothetical protein
MSLLTILLFIVTVYSFEDKETLAKRFKFYKNIKKFSNNTMDVSIDSEKGLSCIANNYIELGTQVLQVPKQYTICSYYMFPFKFEIAEILNIVPGLKESIGIEQKYNFYLATYYLLYYLYAPKETIKQYIIENNITDYYDIDEPDSSMIDSFPQSILTYLTLQPEHIKLLTSMGFPAENIEEIHKVFNYVLVELQRSSYYPLIVPWCSNIEQFLYAYSIIMSRHMKVKIQDWYTLENFKYRKTTKAEDKNKKLMQTTASNTGAPCVVSFVDICNHYQPQYSDMRDKRKPYLDALPGNMVYTVDRSYKAGEEIKYVYTNDPSNTVLYFYYGFILNNNIFNTVQLIYENNDIFTPAQFSLCKELGCLESNLRDPRYMQKVRYYQMTINSIDETAINYARVKYLDNFDPKEVYKQIMNKEIISYENEISACTWYYKLSRDSVKSETYPLQRSIKKSQKFRNMCKELEQQWKNEEDFVKEWMNLKHLEMIYKIEVSYKIILHKQILAAVNRVILHTSEELDYLKTKYLSN